MATDGTWSIKLPEGMEMAVGINDLKETGGPVDKSGKKVERKLAATPISIELLIDPRTVDYDNEMAEKDKLDFTYNWRVVKYSKDINELKIALEFNNPDHISFRHPDYVQMTVCGINDRPETCPSTKKKLPKIFSGGTAELAAAVSTVSNATMI